MAQGNLPVSGSTMTVAQDDGNSSNNNSGSEIRHRRIARPKTPPPMKAAPSTPPRLSHTEDDSISPRPNRARVNSKEYANSYDGAFADVDDMTGFDLNRNAGGWWENQQWFIFLAYVIVLVLLWVLVTMIVSLAKDDRTAKLSMTVTNILHFFVTLIYLHWMKGGTHEDQGDLEHMTLWEQIEGTPNTGRLRLALRLVPTLLCYMACVEVGFREGPWLCCLNCAVWYLTLLGKMPWMNGVRLWGINGHITDRDE